MKILQELGNKNLSIEKKKELSPSNMNEEEISNMKKMYENQVNNDHGKHG